jgi:outer membrane immunogenic protein
MKKSLAASAAFTGLISVACVMGTTAPASAEPFNWNRCYVGAHVAYGWGKDTNDFNNAIASDPTDNGEGVPQEFASFDHTTKGWGGGVQGGCDWQMESNWLLGIEGELMLSGINGEHTNPEDGSDPGSYSRFRSANRWDGDLALRLGYAWPNDLLYGKIGLDAGNFHYTETHDDFPTTHGCGTASGVCSVSFSKTRTGLLLGVGLEHALSSNWTVKLEYDYANFGSTNISYPDAAATIHSFKVHDTKNIVQLGVNFYFP